MQQIVWHKWSLASCAFTALNCLVFYTEKLYKPGPVGLGSSLDKWPTTPTPPIWFALEKVNPVVMLFGVILAIGGMFRKEPALYTWIGLAFALFTWIIGRVLSGPPLIL